MALSQLTEALGVKRAAHLLRRTCFSATKEQIDAFASLTPQQAMQQLFGENPLPEPRLPIDPETGREWFLSGTTDANSDNNDLEGFFMNWKIGEMLSAGVDESQSLSYAFREKLIFFLHTHFTTKRSKVNNSRAMYFQDALFRMYAFDRDDRIIPPPDELTPERTVEINFKDLAKKVSMDNAMLRFLDGRLNVKDNPNENYSRELLELYTIGRGLESAIPEDPQFDGDYIFFTEEDVQQGALVLSGFDTDFNFNNIDEETGLPKGVVKGGTIARQHATGTKTFSFRLENQQVVPNQDLTFSGLPTEESAVDEISQLVDLIFDMPETPRHIIRKLYRYFVYHEVTEELQNTVIQELANTFMENDYKLYPVLMELLTSEHFYDAEAGSIDNNFGGIIKSPLDVVIGFVRSFNLPLPDSQLETEAFYQVTGNYRRSIRLMGMDIYEPFEVAGYAGYHQFPLYYRSWITPNYLTNRYNFVKERVALSATTPEEGQIDTIGWFLDAFPISTIRNAELLIAEVARYMLPVSDNLSFDTAADTGEITPERLNFYLQEFLFREGLGETGEAAWDAIWDSNYDADIVSERLAFLLNAMLQTPEYQLM
ncbi:MAG: DUF1800 family protein [Bacteroidota bacterium]